MDAPPSSEEQLELNLDAKRGSEQDLARMTEVIGGAVDALGEVVGESVSDAIKAALHSAEERRAEDQEHLVGRLEAALERQAARLREALERQAEHFAAAMARQAEIHNENLRTIISEVLKTNADAASIEAAGPTRTKELEGLQETLRLGFAEVRAALDGNQGELIDTVRTELRSSVKRFPPPSLPTRSTVAGVAPDTSGAVPPRAPPLLGSGAPPQSPRSHVVPDHRLAAGGPSPERAPPGHAHGWTPTGTSRAPYTARETGP